MLQFGDVEGPGALEAAARRVATTNGELLLMATGPDLTSIQMANNTLVSLASIGLRKNVLMLADSWTTCEQLLAQPCFWSSRVLLTAPAESGTSRQFWDWRFKFYYVKKSYMARLVKAGFAVLQADTDTVWQHDPFPALRAMSGSSIISMGDGPIANAGVVYARPGSAAAQTLLEDVAWRIQLLQNWPDIVPKLVRFATKPPFYANSDDQTILNDAIVSAVLGNRTFLGSTARFEAKSRYNPRGPPWDAQPESAQWHAQLRQTQKLARYASLLVPWQSRSEQGSGYKYKYYPIGSSDSVAIAPRILFAHLPFSAANAMTHLTAARGFRSKVKALSDLGRWNPNGDQFIHVKPSAETLEPSTYRGTIIKHQGGGGGVATHRGGVGGGGGVKGLVKLWNHRAASRARAP